MANRERGEFSLLAGDTRYRLKLTTNALAELEDFSGKTYQEAVERGLARGSVKSLRLFMWAALREFHPDLATEDPASIKDVGRLIDNAGGVAGMWVQIQAFLKLNEEPEDEVPARPPDAAVPLPEPAAEPPGTGVDSILTLVPSA